MTEVKKCDVAVIGAGISGLSTAMHLIQQGVTNIMLIDSSSGSASLSCPGGLSGSLLDNFTRLSATYGINDAFEIARFVQNAFLSLSAYLDANNLKWNKGVRLRLIDTSQETKESMIACTELNSRGFIADYQSQSFSTPYQDCFSHHILGLQDEGNLAGWVDAAALLEFMKKELALPITIARVLGLEYLSEGLALRLDDGSVVKAEMACVCSHLGIESLVPELVGVFVPYADQWCQFSFTGELNQLEGSFLSKGHGYQWGGRFIGHTLVWGGGRYLRKNAGIGQHLAQPDKAVSHHLKMEVQRCFANIRDVRLLSSLAFSGSRPCDELPVIGPMFGDSRVLIAGGYMGTGLTLGFFAGKCLADFVCFGKSDGMCRRLLPLRLRSMRGD